MSWWSLLVGMLCGAGGLLALSICLAAGHADRHLDRMDREEDYAWEGR